MLPGVRCPTLLIEATAGVVPAGQMAEMARRLPDARHVVLPGGPPGAPGRAGRLPRGGDGVATPVTSARTGAPRRRQTATPVTFARTGGTGCSAANASAGRAVASTQCGSQVPGR